MPTVSSIPLVPVNGKGKGKAPNGRGGDGNGFVVQTEGSHLEDLVVYTNIGPVHDAALVRVGESEQAQIVTCSGDRSAGSLQIIRAGADFEELGIIRGLDNVTNVWPLRSLSDDR